MIKKMVVILRQNIGRRQQSRKGKEESGGERPARYVRIDASQCGYKLSFEEGVNAHGICGWNLGETCIYSSSYSHRH